MIPVTEPNIGEKEREYVLDCINSGWISSIGKYIPLFEKKFSSFCGVSYGVATSNGTTALHLALVILGIGPRDEVIVPDFTFIATSNAVRYTGATPIFVDANKRDWNIDVDLIESKITARTKAIIPVHIYGHPVDMDPILDIAKRYRLYVIEDAAEAHGALYKGKKVGSLGNIGCFSFYGNKIITTGEGGMLITDDPVLAEKAMSLRDHGMSKEKRYWHPQMGYNYRMTNLQAAIGLAQMEQIDEIIKRKRGNASLYDLLLREVKGVILPPEEEWASSVYWLYSILVDESYGINRDELIVRLRGKGIDSRPFFYPNHLMPFYNINEKFPVAEDISQRGLSLPSSAKLTVDQIKYIAEVIKQAPR